MTFFISGIDQLQKKQPSLSFLCQPDTFKLSASKRFIAW
jgi:hypothetical protein